jgi:spectinomycin phosphotransferase/16S rRNA (guanine(1405)-N(7))-methyltransferase
VFTRPHDLADETIAAALRARWCFDPIELVYQPVGFGSHHWLAVARGGRRRFVTIDDLHDAQSSTPERTSDVAYVRLSCAFRAAHAARERSHLSFVVAPLVTDAGDVIVRLTERYAMVVHDHLGGLPAGEDGEFRSDTNRMAVLDCLVALHRASATAAPYADVERGFLPGRHDLHAALDAVDDPWSTGPYAEPARSLLRAHAGGVCRLLEHLDRLMPAVCVNPDHMVFTHGEPHANNVLLGESGPLLVDWESAMMAPPERDLYGLDIGDGAVLTAYTNETGIQLARERLDYYRLWYDLFEIAGYLALFRAPHADTADSAQSWTNLVEFLQPEERWPALFH